jgi:hypothetical protein
MNVRVLPTIAVHSTKHPAGYVTMNLSDFDPTKHVPYFDAAGKPTAPPKASDLPKAPKPAPEPEPDPAAAPEAVPFGALNAHDAIEMVKESDDITELAEWEIAEQAGKGRATVLAALGKRIAEIGA